MREKRQENKAKYKKENEENFPNYFWKTKIIVNFFNK